MKKIIKEIKAMVAVATMTAVVVFGMSGSAYALAIADAQSSITGWSIETTGSLSFTWMDSWSDSYTHSYSPVSGSYYDADYISSIADTSASNLVTEAEGSNDDDASTTTEQAMSASSHTESHGDSGSVLRSGYTYGEQGGYFTLSGTGDLIMTFPYTISISMSGTDSNDYAYSYTDIYAYLHIDSDYDDEYYDYLEDYIGGIGSTSGSKNGTGIITFSVEDGDESGYLYFGSWAYTDAYSEVPESVPEPATLLLLGAGLLGVGVFGRKRIKV